MPLNTNTLNACWTCELSAISALDVSPIWWIVWRDRAIKTTVTIEKQQRVYDENDKKKTLKCEMWNVTA